MPVTPQRVSVTTVFPWFHWVKKKRREKEKKKGKEEGFWESLLLFTSLSLTFLYKQNVLKNGPKFQLLCELHKKLNINIYGPAMPEL